MSKAIGSTDQLLERWQTVINLIAQHYNVPSCLIMKLEGKNIKVELSSKQEHIENPYPIGDCGALENSGLYCEQVIKTQKLLQVTNARTYPERDPTIAIDANKISYLGVPVNWPDESPFGTLCVLDNKEREYPQSFQDLLEQLSHVFELELSLVAEIEQRKKVEASLLIAQEKLLSIEKLAQFSQLSQGISHQLGTPIGTGVTLASHINSLCRGVFKHDTENPSIADLRDTIAEIQSCNEMLMSELSKSTRLLSRLKLSAQNTGLMEKGIIDISACIQDSWKFTAPAEREGIVLEINIEKGCTLLADYAVLIDVFRQLFGNAIDHGLKDQTLGCITVSVFNRKDTTVIKVADNGRGMSATVQESALQPFFSTGKNQGKIGLGLNFVNNLVTTNLGGLLSLESSSSGTIVTCIIPN